MVTYDFSALKLHEQEEIVGLLRLASRQVRQGRYSVPRIQVPEDRWEEVAQRPASDESLSNRAEWPHPQRTQPYLCAE
jgi:hypothetical protein